jgi:hypothetical protein
MQVSRTRLLLAGAATCLAGVLALTAAHGSSAATPTPAGASTGKTAPAAGSPAEVAAKRAAAARVPRGSGGSPGDVAKRAAAARANRNSGSDNLLRRPDAVSSIARSLGVSEAAARAALRTLVPLSEASGGLDPASPGFVAAAGHLGVSPAQLAGAIDALKAAG